MGMMFDRSAQPLCKIVSLSHSSFSFVIAASLSMTAQTLLSERAHLI
jgi:hypothetical protein